MAVKAISQDPYTIGITTKQTGIGYLKMATRKRKTPIVADEMKHQEIHFRMELTKENPDGSTDFVVDANEYTMAKLVELGVISLLKEHIQQEALKRSKPWWKFWK